MRQGDAPTDYQQRLFTRRARDFNQPTVFFTRRLDQQIKHHRSNLISYRDVVNRPDVDVWILAVGPVRMHLWPAHRQTVLVAPPLQNVSLLARDPFTLVLLRQLN